MFPCKNIITKLNLTTNKVTTEATVVNNEEEHLEWMKQLKDVIQDDNSNAALYNNELISADSSYDPATNTIYFLACIFNS